MHEKIGKLPDFFLIVHWTFFKVLQPAHRARATNTYLNANNENVIDFPHISPYFNIIKNIWDELNHRVRRTGAILTTLNQLRAKILRVEQPPSEFR